MAETLLELYLRERAKNGSPKKVLLDLDATDDPTHGDQESSYYHGYYQEHIYHPLLVFDGESGQLITAVLRAGNTHASRSAVVILKRIATRLKERWPSVEIELRADAGFAVPALYEYCESEGICYTIGLISNPRLEALTEGLLEEAKERYYEAQEEKVRLLSEDYYRAQSWDHARRVIYKAEVMAEGTNTRFVVTNRMQKPTELYEWYIKRGETEKPHQGLQGGAQSRQAQLLSLFGQPVPVAIACCGLLVVGRFEKEAA